MKRTLLTFVVGLLLGASPALCAYFPAQFIAKMYSEALGRIPDQGGWQFYRNYYTQAGCNQANLRAQGPGFYLGQEFTDLGYDNTSKLLALYRGVLNREPDAGGFQYWLNLLNSGSTWSFVVNEFFHSGELQALTTSICNASQPSYGFGNYPVITLSTLGSGFQGGTGAQLQSILNATPPGGVVWLAQRAVVRLSAPLVIPQGVRLATTGSPAPKRYAVLARLVRETLFAGPMIQLSSGAILQNVWVTGQRSRLGFSAESINVEMRSGTNTKVSHSRIENPAGNTNLKAWAGAPGVFPPCVTNYIGYNFVTSFATNHLGGLHADGLSIACESTTVEQNELIDATDVPIILFRATPYVQRSLVRSNRILNAGNSAYGGLAFDPWLPFTGTLHDFAGSKFENNLLWTSPSAHYDIGLSAGTRPWFGADAERGTGGSFVGNTSGSETVRVDIGIAVSGMMNAYVQGNTLNMSVINFSQCPTTAIAAAISAGYASGTIQGPVTDVDVSACNGGPPAH